MVTSRIHLILIFMISFGAAAAEKENCRSLKLHYSSNDVPDLPPTPSIWGGRATEAGNSAPLMQDFIRGAERAKAAGNMTMMYLEGPCGLTNGKDPMDEEGNCRRKFQKFNKEHGAKVPDKKTHRWEPYTLEQLKLSKKYQIDFCEIDNLDNSYGATEFLKTYKKLYDAGEIQCKLVLKNIDANKIKEFASTFGKSPSFVSKLNLFEADELWAKKDKSQFNSKRTELIKAMRDWMGEGAMTLMSKKSGDYRSVNFTQDPVMGCGRSESQIATAPEAPGDGMR